MSITEEEKNEIIDMAVEKALLLLPETVGALMANHAAMAEINKKFYSDYPEFKNNRDAVMSVVEKIEGENPLLDHKGILKKAVPEIRKRIETLKKTNMTTISANPNRQFKQIEAPSDKDPSDENSCGII